MTPRERFHGSFSPARARAQEAFRRSLIQSGRNNLSMPFIPSDSTSEKRRVAGDALLEITAMGTGATFTTLESHGHKRATFLEKLHAFHLPNGSTAKLAFNGPGSEREALLKHFRGHGTTPPKLGIFIGEKILWQLGDDKTLIPIIRRGREFYFGHTGSSFTLPNGMTLSAVFVG